MSSFADRLRGAIGTVGAGGAAGRTASEQSGIGGAHDAGEILDGEWRESRGQRFLVIDRKYPPGHRHGHMAIADTLPPDDQAWPRLSLLSGGSPARGRMLFVDLETTGLAGGAGTYAFLVGCAWYQGGSLRVRQFLLSSFSAERALLEAVAETAAAYGAVVTYNGKSFDLPVMEMRFVLHRMQTPFADMPHVDMLHPARRLWRDEGSEESGCRLTGLEFALCGHVREGDVPGFEIPARYFHFVRTGESRGLAAVLEHNRLDLISLAMVTARASQLLEDGPSAARSAREALGMGRLYDRAGMIDEARASYVRAAETVAGDTNTRAEAWRACALLLRRQRRYGDAAAAWHNALSLPACPPLIAREASEALAVHHEHRVRDIGAARTFALQSLSFHPSPSRLEATRHRLGRLNRKLADAGGMAAALF